MLEGIVSPNRRKAIIRNWLNRRMKGQQVEWEGIAKTHVGKVEFVTYSPYGDEFFYAYVVAGNPVAPEAATYIKLG